MTQLLDALRGARHAVRPDAPPPGALVIGAGGALGSAVLAQALVDGRYAQVAALVQAPLGSTIRGLRPVRRDALARQVGELGIALAFMVFERGRRANGRDDAFELPPPSDLLPLARELHAAGVRHLVVVVPHAPALLPQALKAGFETEAEAEVAALGFAHVVFLRAARDAIQPGLGERLARFAAWWLRQLNWLVPQAQAPVRNEKLAELVVALARELPTAAPGTRVVPPELIWRASQAADARPLLRGWLHGTLADSQSPVPEPAEPPTGQPRGPN